MVKRLDKAARSNGANEKADGGSVSAVPDAIRSGCTNPLLTFLCVIGSCCILLFVLDWKEAPWDTLGSSVSVKSGNGSTSAIFMKSDNSILSKGSSTSQALSPGVHQLPGGAAIVVSSKNLILPRTYETAPTVPNDPFAGINLASASKMYDVFTQQRELVKLDIIRDYGDYEKYFTIPTSDGRHSLGNNSMFVSPSQLLAAEEPENFPSNATDLRGFSHFVRKWQIKILQAQINYLKQNKEKKNYKKELARFVWVNGGHSSSAGHGNFFRESYTANLERRVKPVLASLGIDFEGRNYAMGGTSSGEEIAFCSQAVFGKDIDTLTWDYGMGSSELVLSLTPSNICSFILSHSPFRISCYVD